MDRSLVKADGRTPLVRPKRGLAVTRVGLRAAGRDVGMVLLLVKALVDLFRPVG